jgi:hypothetical protein
MKHLRKFNENESGGYFDRYSDDDKPSNFEEPKLPLSVTINISQSIIDTCLKFGIHEETIEEVFKGYLDHILGYNTHGDDGFEDWLEDNADDWVN